MEVADSTQTLWTQHTCRFKYRGRRWQLVAAVTKGVCVSEAQAQSLEGSQELELKIFYILIFYKILLRNKSLCGMERQRGSTERRDKAEASCGLRGLSARIKSQPCCGAS